MKELIPYGVITSRIFLIKGKSVMLDRDLAELYGVETRALNQAVRRNIDRFPKDFMFSLTRQEIMNLSQFVISSKIKHAPNVFVFTEQGVAMLSSVLNSKRAVAVNIQIMRAFVKIRHAIAKHRDLARRVGTLESIYLEHGEHIKDHDRQIKSIFDVMKQLSEPQPEEQKEKIGFIVRRKS